ncbi:helix-turn-helix domain-containing protein [Streptomyces sp. NPDC090445]|uniref:helix-turn-helix domain-containing protein n=1 Tax=Streptomyces sp. NPDC090445 TaxID=3365963 RepID=UPI00381A914F
MTESAEEPEHTGLLTPPPADTPSDRGPSSRVAGPDAAAEPGPRGAFDALYRAAAPGLVRQTYLLTGLRFLALEAVERAFQQAWARWPEVATDPDPAGWVRAAAYEYALSPWHRFRRGVQEAPDPDLDPDLDPDPGLDPAAADLTDPADPADPADRILRDALLDLSPTHRRTVLLYHGAGLDLPDTAAETEASTPAAGIRLLNAHDELAARVPELAGAPPEERLALLEQRLGALEPPVPLVPRPPAAVRRAAEHRTRRWTQAVVGVTAMIAVATSYTLATAPTRYEAPVAPGVSVSGVPPLSGPQQLTEENLQLHDKLRADPAAGPARLAPRAE